MCMCVCRVLHVEREPTTLPISLLRLLNKRPCGAEPYLLIGTRKQWPSKLGTPLNPLSSLVDDFSGGGLGFLH